MGTTASGAERIWENNMKRILITCDCCLEDIGFDDGTKTALYGELKYPDGRRRELCKNCFESFEQILINARADYEARKNAENE